MVFFPENSFFRRRKLYRIPSLLKEINGNLEKAYDLFSADREKARDPSEWLLDNYYVIRHAILQITQDIGFSFHRQLPLQPDTRDVDRTRVFHICRKLTSRRDSIISIAGTASFLRQYQKTTPLTTAELWAVPVMLRLSVLINLSEELVSMMDENGEGKGVSAAVLNLRKIEQTDWKSFFEKVSPVEKILRRDPAGIYRSMDFHTRDSYRKSVENLCRKYDTSEMETAEASVALALEKAPDTIENHIGWYLMSPEGMAILRKKLNLPRGFQKPGRKTLSIWFTGVILFAAVLFVSYFQGITPGGSIPAGVAVFLLFIPAVAFAVELVFQAALCFTSTVRLPKLDYRNGIPNESRTMVVIPSILSTQEEADEILGQIERHYLSNGGTNILFGLLTDLQDSETEVKRSDAAIYDTLIRGIQRLNSRYCSSDAQVFHLFHRKRRWNPSENVWMGWERKRGKLEEFNRLLLGLGETSFCDCTLPANIKYVITLDCDTMISGGTAAALIGAMAHPLNRYTGERGYTVMQPRTLPLYRHDRPSPFFRGFSGDFSVDLYSNAVSDVYQDLFGEGIYMGKGIYDLRAFHAATAGRIPENTLLSHDLLEGLLGRAGYLSDVVVYEDFPENFTDWLKRQNRWIRGDWQLLPWLFKKGFSLLDRWKMADNMRRSLTGFWILLLLISGWFLLNGNLLLLWTFAAVIVLFRSQIVQCIFTGFRVRGSHWLRGLLDIALLPVNAVSSMKEVLVTLFRVLFSRRNMLQWTSAAVVSTKHDSSTGRVAPGVTLFSGCLIIAMLLSMGSVPIPSVPFLLIWGFLPVIMKLISPKEKIHKLPVFEENDLLLKTALRTWYFFDVFVGPEDHWLPPDHYQEEPLNKVAHRTSPTNIGLFLLSVIAAGDLGFTGIRQLLLRVEDSLEGMKKLSRYRGHILNWHNTKTLEPLKPRYVSTVDSGNLLASLITLNHALDDSIYLSPGSRERWQCLAAITSELASTVRKSGVFGEDLLKILLEIIEITEKQLEDSSCGTETLKNLCVKQFSLMDGMLIELIEAEVHNISQEEIGELRTWSERLRYHLSDMMDEIETLYPWLLQMGAEQVMILESSDEPRVRDAWKELRKLFPEKPSPALVLKSSPETLNGIRALKLSVKNLMHGEEGDKLLDWLKILEEMVEESRKSCLQLVNDIDRIKQIIDSEIKGMDFSFLYSERRKVFRIGFNVDTEQPDTNCYDLLASEARLASLLAIARRDVPFDHWLHLSRPFTSVSGMVGLLSWSGTMFEYLMPLIFTGYRSDTILGQSCAAAVGKQIEYGREKNIPWGISESGYYWFDQSKQYQYKAFGVPGLGYRRGLEEDLVIAPYASVLALPLRKHEVMKNLSALNKLDMTGRYGFYEAIDFTQERLPAGKEYRRIWSYMAHHQGMILLSIQNALQNDKIVERFHRDLEVSTVELLLHESSPGNPRIVYARPRQGTVTESDSLQTHLEKWIITRQTPSRVAHCISGGNLGAVLTETGKAFLSWKGKDITGRDSSGERVLIRNMATGEVRDSCAGSQPVWYPHKAEYMNKIRDLTVFTGIIAAPEYDGLIRRVTLTNHSSERKKYFVCSLMEPVLADPGEYNRHPEFNRLFLSTSFSKEHGALLVSRRNRYPGEEGMAAGMFIPGEKTVSFETERENIIGRGGSRSRPRGLLEGRGFTGKTGSTVDPLLAMGLEISLGPEESRTLSFVTVCGEEESELLRTIENCSNPESVDTEFQQSEVFTRRELAACGADSDLMRRMQPVLSSLLFPSWRLRPEEKILRMNRLGQRHLWRFGISGDIPVLVVTADTEDNLDIVRDLLRIHRLWMGRGVISDLVILNQETAGYENELHGRLRRLLTSTGSEKWEGRRGGVFLLNEGLMEHNETILLKTWASVVLNCTENLGEQTRAFHDEPVRQPDLVPVPVEYAHDVPEVLSSPEGLLFFNGYGGFTKDGREYVIYLEDGKWLPRPWINVIASEKAGMTASESGIQCLWAFNSGENRLIPWRNDPVEDTPGMAVYVRDEETGEFWSPSPLPVRDRNPYLVRHGAGYTVWEHNRNGLIQKMTVFTDSEEPAAAINISIENPGPGNRRIGVIVYAEPVLGTERNATSRFLLSGFNTACNAIFTWNTAAEKPPSGVFFLASSRTPSGITTDRTEFLGKDGSMGNPAAMRRTGLSGRIRAGLDPCAAIQVMIWIGPGERKEVTFLAGQESSEERAADLIRKQMFRATSGTMLRESVLAWDTLLDALHIETPDTAMNLMVNRWLLYQTLSCRLYGRTALYQSSGAFGFRDQLQDCLALCTANQEIPGKHILECASKQFIEGDVLHWWHPPLNAGVRTRCSDDLLWLPYAVAEYVRKTGDKSILDEMVPYLDGEILSEDQMERYDRFIPSTKKETLHKHCVRALYKGLTKGPHGLPLMGSHDWNDGMSLVGHQGKGESVWLGWFLYKALISYSQLCAGDQRNRLVEEAQRLKDTLNEVSWDGDWYLRGFYDDGYPLGSKSSRECMIASIAQSWAVISGAGDKSRNDRAMASVMEHLVDHERGLVLLFSPPFDKTSHHPGYIMGYPPGVRENGGQYTHAAVWAAWAQAMAGNGSRAMEIFNILNPVNKSFPEHKADTYRVEPYAVAADVYASPECSGRGGWTWYTGASGWMYRLATETILGMNVEGSFLLINPCVPETWEEWRVTLLLKGCRWNILFSNPESVSTGIRRILVNGTEIEGNRVELCDTVSENTVHVTMGTTDSE